MQVNEGILTDRTVVTDALNVKETSIGCKAGSPKPPDFVNDMVLHTGLLNPGWPNTSVRSGCRNVTQQNSSAPDFRSDAHSAGVVGGWEKPSGESRFLQNEI